MKRASVLHTTLIASAGLLIFAGTASADNLPQPSTDNETMPTTKIATPQDAQACTSQGGTVVADPSHAGQKVCSQPFHIVREIDKATP